MALTVKERTCYRLALSYGLHELPVLCESGQKLTLGKTNKKIEGKMLLESSEDPPLSQLDVLKSVF